MNLREFKAITLLLVLDLQEECKEERQDTEGREYQHRHKITAGEVENGPDQQRYEAQADVLHPEDEAVSASKHLFVNNLGD